MRSSLTIDEIMGYSSVGWCGLERNENWCNIFCRRSRRFVKKPAFRLEVVDCTASGGAKKVDRTDAFVVLLDHDDSALQSGNGASGGNRWVKRRQRKMGTVRFFDDRLARSPATDTGKTIQ